MPPPSPPLGGGHGCGAGTYGVVRILGGERPTLPLYGSERAALAIHCLPRARLPALTGGLPGALGHARQLATVSHLTKAHAAQAELAVHGVRTAAALAAGVAAHAALPLAGGLRNESLLRHGSRLLEREAEVTQQGP